MAYLITSMGYLFLISANILESLNTLWITRIIYFEQFFTYLLSQHR